MKANQTNKKRTAKQDWRWRGWRDLWLSGAKNFTNIKNPHFSESCSMYTLRGYSDLKYSNRTAAIILFASAIIRYNVCNIGINLFTPTGIVYIMKSFIVKEVRHTTHMHKKIAKNNYSIKNFITWNLWPISIKKKQLSANNIRSTGLPVLGKKPIERKKKKSSNIFQTEE